MNVADPSTWRTEPDDPNSEKACKLAQGSVVVRVRDIEKLDRDLGKAIGELRVARERIKEFLTDLKK